MRRREDLSSDPPATERAALADRISEVPDMLVAVQLYLRPLANGETYEIPADARRIIGHACDLLNSALANVLDVTGNRIDSPPANARRRSSDGSAKEDDDSSGA
jgi:hypothetical protein